MADAIETPAGPTLALVQRLHAREELPRYWWFTRLQVVVDQVNQTVGFGFGGARAPRDLDASLIECDGLGQIANLSPQPTDPVGYARKHHAVVVPLGQVERLLHGIHGRRNPAAIGARQSQIEQRQRLMESISYFRGYLASLRLCLFGCLILALPKMQKAAVHEPGWQCRLVANGTSQAQRPFVMAFGFGKFARNSQVDGPIDPSFGGQGWIPEALSQGHGRLPVLFDVHQLAQVVR